MSYKKNAVSYGIWALYLTVVGIVLSFLGMAVGGQGNGIPYMALLLLALAFGALALIYFLSKKIVDSVKIKKMAAGKAALVEAILVAVLLLTGIALRILLIGEAGEEAAYYEVAKVTENGMQVQLVQGSIYYYLCLLNGLFRLVGNKWMAGIVLQIALQMLGIGISYFAVRRLSGRGSALVALVFLTVAPGSVRAGMTYSPKMLYFCMYALILLIIAGYMYRTTRSGGRVLTWILAVLCGALAGFAGYTDIVGFTLAIPLFGLPTLKREERGTVLWAAQLFLALIALAGTFCLLTWLDGAVSGSDFGRVLGAWADTYRLKGADYNFIFREAGYETVVMLVLISLGVFTFMRRKSEEMFSPWVITLLSVTLLRVLGIVTPNMNGSYQMYFAMAGLAGVSLSELFVQGGGVADIPEVVVEDLDEMSADPVAARRRRLPAEAWPPEPAAGAAPAADTAPAPAKTERERQPEKPAGRRHARKQKRQMETDVPVWESLSQETAADGRDSEVKEDMAGKKQEDAQKQVQFIENPLPLPKKHVKKVMDYPIQPEASLMHYDIEVDPGDNFDF
ncbi:MAG: hypothetical protein K1W26_00575 [Acetatifactor sp.]